jgi:hypothetical protein
MIEMSPIEVDAHPMDVARDREVFRAASIQDDLPVNVHPGLWIANSFALGLLIFGCSIWWGMS